MEGIYLIKHPLLFFIRPKLIIRRNKKQRLTCQFSYLKHQKKVRVIREDDQSFYGEFFIDIVRIEMMVKAFNKDYLDGFFDTPIGHYRFVAKKVKRR